jgi:tetratricopeptide (TPR) repeat protein
MSRVTSLTSMSDKQLNRWIKRIGLLFVVALIAFAGFYAVDRFRMPTAPIADQKTVVLEEAVRKDPSNVSARGQLADLYYAKGRFEDAITQYTTLIDAKKDVELATLGRGNAYRALEKWPEATKDYQAVVNIAASGEMSNVDTNLESAYFGLGMIALGQDKAEEAVDPLLKALAISRTDADALNAIGLAYTKTDQPDQAIAVLRQAVALVPVGWAEPYQNMAVAYTKLNEPDLAAWAGAMATLEAGDSSGAEAQLLKLVNGDAAGEATVGLGIVYEERGDSGTAATWYQKALDLDQNNEPALMGLRRAGGAKATASPQPSASSSPVPSGSN